jgi:hypothetical protein
LMDDLHGICAYATVRNVRLKVKAWFTTPVSYRWLPV